MRFSTFENSAGFGIARTVEGKAGGTVMISPLQPDDATALSREELRRYFETARDALQRDYGTPEEIRGGALGQFYGIDIPPALEEIAPLLRRSEGMPLTERTPAMLQAIRRFIEYCDAEGIKLPEKPKPDAMDIRPGDGQDPRY